WAACRWTPWGTACGGPWRCRGSCRSCRPPASGREVLDGLGRDRDRFGECGDAPAGDVAPRVVGPGRLRQEHDPLAGALEHDLRAGGVADVAQAVGGDAESDVRRE